MIFMASGATADQVSSAVAATLEATLGQPVSVIVTESRRLKAPAAPEVSARREGAGRRLAGSWRAAFRFLARGAAAADALEAAGSWAAEGSAGVGERLLAELL